MKLQMLECVKKFKIAERDNLEIFLKSQALRQI